jgi:hypothetical protein
VEARCLTLCVVKEQYLCHVASSWRAASRPKNDLKYSIDRRY